MNLTCNQCEVEKPEGDFAWATAKGSRRGRCKACEYENRKKRHASDPEKYRRMRRFRQVKYMFGLNEEQVLELLEKQEWKCAICFVAIDETAAFDHDHECCPGHRSCGSCVRGILCKACNWGLGHFSDEPVVLERAATYLRRYKCD